MGAILNSWRERVAALAGEKRSRFVVVLLGTFLGELDQLVSNAPDTPDVYSVSVLLFDENDLRCPKPPGANVTRKAPDLLVLVAGIGPREAKVTHLDLAEPVEEDVGGLQVPMDNVGAL